MEAFKILLEEEQIAVTLSITHGKSTWQAGEIMGKSHYKYLEILDRAKTLLRIFTLHYRKHTHLIPPDVPISDGFKEYLLHIMEDRLSIRDSINRMEGPNRLNYYLKPVRERTIYGEMKLLANSKTPGSEDLFQLIMEFDRWNNFRILPEELQEPSAFKRRAKVRFQKYLRKMTTLPETSLKLIQKKFKYSGTHQRVYVALVNDNIPNTKYLILPIRNSNTNLEYFGKLGLPVYKDKSKALEFGQLIATYYALERKTPRLGQTFWRNFRLMLKEAINYNDLEHIKKNRAHILRNVDFNDKAINARKRQKISKSRGSKRLSDKELGIE